MSRSNLVSSFVSQVNGVIEDIGVETIKEVIGDSVENNRNLTVNQVIRYLTSRKNTGQRSLGRRLAVVYNAHRTNIVRLNRAMNRRTDAVDVTEFNNYINLYSGVSTSFNRSVGQLITNA